MKTKKTLDHLLIGFSCALVGTLIGLLLVEFYWLYKGYKWGTTYDLLKDGNIRSQILTLSQVPNVLIFFGFFQTKRDRSAYGVVLLFILVAIPIALEKLL